MNKIPETKKPVSVLSSALPWGLLALVPARLFSGILALKLETTTYGLQKENVNDTASHAKENKCDVCSRDLKRKATLLNHDKKFHILKGTNIYKCDNCKEKMDDKTKLINHITKEHIYCTICRKILLNPTSLNFHMIAVHESKKEKHQLEKEPSLRNIKVKKYN